MKIMVREGLTDVFNAPTTVTAAASVPFSFTFI